MCQGPVLYDAALDRARIPEALEGEQAETLDRARYERRAWSLPYPDPEKKGLDLRLP